MKYSYLFLVLVLSLVGSLGAQSITDVVPSTPMDSIQTCYTEMIASPTPVPATLIQDIDTTFDRCATAKIEVDYPTWIMYGGNYAEVSAKILPKLEDVATIYDNSAMEHYGVHFDIEFDIHYWTEPSPYTGPSSGSYLNSFWQNMLPHNSMVAMLLGANSSGGIAYVDVVCHPVFGASFSNMINQHIRYPEYSWPVMVIAHELGHMLSSHHTHGCVWNGNGTAIDGCAGGTEGDCPNPGIPADGGTIMSYCHLTGAGIDFTKGFGAQPMAVIINAVDNATCNGCTGNPPPPPPSDCEDNRIYVTVNTDAYPDETSFEIIDENAVVVASGGPWGRDSAFTEIQDSFCLENGCYRFVITDENGLSGGPCGDGSFILSNGADLVYSGSDFIGTSEFTFCFGDDLECTLPNFDGLESYANQDVSQDYTVEDGVLSLSGNTWRVKEYVYELTASTVLNVDLKVDIEGEIHGIGLLQTADYLQPQFTFRLAGTQNWWGIDLMDNDSPAIGEWVSFEIPIGQVMAAEGHLGVFTHLLFANDHDAPPSNAASHFRNVELCEYTDAGIAALTVPQYKIDRTYDPGKKLAPALEKTQQRKVIYPNPVNDVLRLPGKYQYAITNALGNLVATGEDEIVNVSELPSGVYLVSYGGQTHRIVKQ